MASLGWVPGLSCRVEVPSSQALPIIGQTGQCLRAGNEAWAAWDGWAQLVRLRPGKFWPWQPSRETQTTSSQPPLETAVSHPVSCTQGQRTTALHPACQSLASQLGVGCVRLVQEGVDRRQLSRGSIPPPVPTSSPTPASAQPRTQPPPQPLTQLDQAGANSEASSLVRNVLAQEFV